MRIASTDEYIWLLPITCRLAAWSTKYGRASSLNRLVFFIALPIPSPVHARKAPVPLLGRKTALAARFVRVNKPERVNQFSPFSLTLLGESLKIPAMPLKVGAYI